MGPTTVKKQIALERATHKSTHGSSKPNYKILLVQVLDVVVVPRWHLHEVASCARVEEVVHCSGRSGKAIKTEIVNRVRTCHYGITNATGKVKTWSGCSRTSIYGGYSVYQNIEENQEVTLTACHRSAIHLPTQASHNLVSTSVPRTEIDIQGTR